MYRQSAQGKIAAAIGRAGKTREAVDLVQEMGASMSAVYALVDIAAAWKKPR